MKYQIIKSSNWKDYERLVLIKWLYPDGSIFQYSTHLENRDDGELMINYGHYFYKKDLAIKDFCHRYIFNNIN